MSSEIDKLDETPQEGESTSPARIGRTPKRYSPEHIRDRTRFAHTVYQNQHLSDEEFNAMVDDIGIRVMRLELCAKVADGDVRAMDLYDKITTRDRIKRKELDPAEVNVSPAPFVQQPRRNPTADEDDSSSR